MKDPNEDHAYEQWHQHKIDCDMTPDSMPYSIPIHQKVGTVIPFSRTVDRDPNPRIPLSVPQESPVLIEVWAWSIVAVFVALAYWWVAV